MSKLNKMFTTDLIHLASFELNANAQFEHPALELVVESKFLLSCRYVLHVYVFNDISCYLSTAKMAVSRNGPVVNCYHK